MSDMSEQIQRLLDRIESGDSRARRELLEVAYARICEIADQLLWHLFPQLNRSHEAGSVVHQCWPKLAKALEAQSVRLTTTKDFLRFVRHKLRQTEVVPIPRTGEVLTLG